MNVLIILIWRLIKHSFDVDDLTKMISVLKTSNWLPHLLFCIRLSPLKIILTMAILSRNESFSAHAITYTNNSILWQLQCKMTINNLSRMISRPPVNHCSLFSFHFPAHQDSQKIPAQLEQSPDDSDPKGHKIPPSSAGCYTYIKATPN